MSELANTFNIIDTQQAVVQRPTPPKQVQKKTVATILDDSMLEDFQQTRHNFNLILELGRNALGQACTLAEAATDPRWYRVVSELMSSVTETNKELLSVYEKLSVIKKNNVAADGGTPKEELKGGVIIDKAVFIGSTQELLEQLKLPSKIEHGPITR